MAIAGFLLAFFCSLLGLLLSILALGEIDRSRGQLGGRGLATAGIWISVISMIFGLLLLMARSHS